MRLFVPVKSGLSYAIGTTFRSSDIDWQKIPAEYAGGQVYVRALFLKLALTITAGGGGATIAAGALARLISTAQLTVEGLGRPLVDTVKGLNIVRNRRVANYGRRGSMVNGNAEVLGGGASAAVALYFPLVGGHGGALRASDFSLHARAFEGASTAIACATALTDVAAGLASITGTVDAIAEVEVKPKIEGSNPTTVEEIAIAAAQTDPTIAPRDGFLLTASVGRQLAIFANTEQTSIQHGYGDQNVLDRTDDVDSAYLSFNMNAESGAALESHISESPAIDDCLPLVYPPRDRRGQKLSDAPDLLAMRAVHKPDVATNAYDIVREFSWRRCDASGNPSPWFREYAAKLGVSVDSLMERTITASKKPLHPSAGAIKGRFPSK